MRRFIIQTLLFAASAFLVAYIAVAVIVIKAKSSFKLTNPETTLVFFGNSHVMTGVNDSMIPGSYNFGRNGERMEWVYAKVRLILDNNPQVKTIGIGFDNVLCFHNQGTEKVHMQNMSPYFLGVWSPEDFLALWRTGTLTYNFDMYTKSLNVAKLYEAYREGGKGAEALTMGGFDPSDRNALQEDIRRRGINIQDGNAASDTQIGNSEYEPMAHYFLDRIIEYCREKGVKVFFFLPPQHHLLRNSLKKSMLVYREFYDTIPYLNYMDVKLPDSCFQDLDHLNRKGADKFSRMLGKDLETADFR